MRQTKLHRKFNFALTFLLLLFFVVTFFYSREQSSARDALVYSESLDLVAAEINGIKLSLKDLAFYVAYEEAQVEELALVYEPNDPLRYWNLRSKDGFTSTNARKAAMQMALHDELFYQMAEEDGISLTREEEKYLGMSMEDFWEDLAETDGDKKLGVTREELAETMRKLTIAQKYQEIYAAMQNKDIKDFDIDGNAFKRLLDKQEYTVYEKVWKRVSFGNVTLEH